jgi:outer membrane protein assembly factor BamE (lipoprotein component of BamABCDE complex)
MKGITIIFSIILLTSCSQIEKRGYSFELSDYKNLKEGINSKKDTLDAMGYPSLADNFPDNELWIYYSEDIRKLLFFKPEIVDRQIITISFDKDQTIKKISNYNLTNQNQIIINPNYTKVESTKLSWWKQIFGNIGQVRAN